MTHDTSDTLPADPRTRVSDRVADRILARIASGEWAVGQRLPGERQLAEDMGVSRVSVRAALQTLKTQGLLDAVQGGGTRVVSTAACMDASLAQLVKANHETLADLAEIRGQIEVWAARRAARDYTNALHLLTPASAAWTVPVLTCSALERGGIAEVWAAIGSYRQTMTAIGRFDQRRAEQAHAWMWNEINETLLQALKDDDSVATQLPALERDVTAGSMAPGAAARRLVKAFRQRN